MKKEHGSQGIAELPTAYQLGLQCPIGLEIELLLGLDKWWPDLQYRTKAAVELVMGLGDRVCTTSEPEGRANAMTEAPPISESRTMTPIKGETYFYQGRPVVVMKIEPGRCLIRAGNSSKKLDVWVTWEELGGWTKDD